MYDFVSKIEVCACVLKLMVYVCGSMCRRLVSCAFRVGAASVVTARQWEEIVDYPRPVKFFSEFNYSFSGYFEPINICFDNKSKYSSR